MFHSIQLNYTSSYQMHFKFIETSKALIFQTQTKNIGTTCSIGQFQKAEMNEHLNGTPSAQISTGRQKPLEVDSQVHEQRDQTKHMLPEQKRRGLAHGVAPQARDRPKQHGRRRCVLQ